MVNPYDELLVWCSEVRSASTARLIDAARWALRAVGEIRREHDLISDLQALGHVEVDWRRGRWQVAPTTLCRLEDADGLWLLAGSRPVCFDDLMESLTRSSDPVARDVYQDFFQHDPVVQRGPSSVYVTLSDSPAARRVLESLGIRVLDAPAHAILALLKASPLERLGQRRTVRPGELQGRMPAGVVTRNFPWETWPRDDLPGVYRYLQNGRRVFAVRRNGVWVELDRETAVWLGASDTTEPLFTRSPGLRQLYVRDIARLPVLAERALVLRTGRLPGTLTDERVTGQRGSVRVFENVTGAEADVVSALLEKRCEIV